MSDETNNPTDDDGWGDVADLEKELQTHGEEDVEESDDEIRRQDPLGNLDERRKTGAQTIVPTSEAAQASEAIAETSSRKTLDGGASALVPASSVESAAKTGEESESDDSAPLSESHKQPKARPKRRAATGGRRIWPVLTIIGVIAIAVFVVLSEVNRGKFAIECLPDQLVAKQGNYWPWGMDTIEGEAYRPIVIPPDSECSNAHYSDMTAVETRMLKVLLSRASDLLRTGETAGVELATNHLRQATLIARNPDHRNSRKTIQRLEGDIDYWKAAAEVKESIKQLENSAALFEAAAKRNPRHNGDSLPWARHTRSLARQLGAGPNNVVTTDDAGMMVPQFFGTGTSAAPQTTSPAETIEEPLVEPKPDPTETDSATEPHGDAGVMLKDAAAPEAAPDQPSQPPSTPSSPKPTKNKQLPQGGVLM